QLVSDVYAGNRAVAERADHQVIGKIHGEGHRVLQRDRDGEPHKRLVKIPVSRKEHIFHFLLNTTAANCVFGLIIMNPMANVNIRRRLRKVCGARAARIPAKRKIKRKKGFRRVFPAGSLLHVHHSESCVVTWPTSPAAPVGAASSVAVVEEVSASCALLSVSLPSGAGDGVGSEEAGATASPSVFSASAENSSA